MPWTQAEDDKLVEMAAVGASSDTWERCFPRRTFGEVADRRAQLRDAGTLKLAKLL